MRALTLLDPASLFREMDELFHGVTEGRVVPALDIEETDEAYVVTVDAPGFDKSDIEIEVGSNLLMLRGKKVEKEGRRFLRRERVRSVSEFARSIRLPSDVDHDRATASFANGEITITLPKRSSDARKKIPIA